MPPHHHAGGPKTKPKPKAKRPPPPKPPGAFNVVQPDITSPFEGISHTNAPARNTKTPHLTAKVQLAKVQKARLENGGLLTPEQIKSEKLAKLVLATPEAHLNRPTVPGPTTPTGAPRPQTPIRRRNPADDDPKGGGFGTSFLKPVDRVASAIAEHKGPSLLDLYNPFKGKSSSGPPKPKTFWVDGKEYHWKTPTSDVMVPEPERQRRGGAHPEQLPMSAQPSRDSELWDTLRPYTPLPAIEHNVPAAWKAVRPYTPLPGAEHAVKEAAPTVARAVGNADPLVGMLPVPLQQPIRDFKDYAVRSGMVGNREDVNATKAVGKLGLKAADKITKAGDKGVTATLGQLSVPAAQAAGKLFPGQTKFNEDQFKQIQAEMGGMGTLGHDARTVAINRMVRIGWPRQDAIRMVDSDVLHYSGNPPAHPIIQFGRNFASFGATQANAPAGILAIGDASVRAAAGDTKPLGHVAQEFIAGTTDRLPKIGDRPFFQNLYWHPGETIQNAAIGVGVVDSLVGKAAMYSGLMKAAPRTVKPTGFQQPIPYGQYANRPLARTIQRGRDWAIRSENPVTNFIPHFGGRARRDALGREYYNYDFLPRTTHGVQNAALEDQVRVMNAARNVAREGGKERVAMLNSLLQGSVPAERAAFYHGIAEDVASREGRGAARGAAAHAKISDLAGEMNLTALDKEYMTAVRQAMTRATETRMRPKDEGGPGQFGPNAAKYRVHHEPIQIAFANGDPLAAEVLTAREHWLRAASEQRGSKKSRVNVNVEAKLQEAELNVRRLNKKLESAPAEVPRPTKAAARIRNRYEGLYHDLETPGLTPEMRAVMEGKLEKLRDQHPGHDPRRVAELKAKLAERPVAGGAPEEGEVPWNLANVPANSLYLGKSPVTGDYYLRLPNGEIARGGTTKGPWRFESTAPGWRDVGAEAVGLPHTAEEGSGTFVPLEHVRLDQGGLTAAQVRENELRGADIEAGYDDPGQGNEPEMSPEEAARQAAQVKAIKDSILYETPRKPSPFKAPPDDRYTRTRDLDPDAPDMPLPKKGATQDELRAHYTEDEAAIKGRAAATKNKPNEVGHTVIYQGKMLSEAAQEKAASKLQKQYPGYHVSTWIDKDGFYRLYRTRDTPAEETAGAAPAKERHDGTDAVAATRKALEDAQGDRAAGVEGATDANIHALEDHLAEVIEDTRKPGELRPGDQVTGGPERKGRERGPGTVLEVTPKGVRVAWSNGSEALEKDAAALTLEKPTREQVLHRARKIPVPYLKPREKEALQEMGLAADYTQKGGGVPQNKGPFYDEGGMTPIELQVLARAIRKKNEVAPVGTDKERALQQAALKVWEEVQKRSVAAGIEDHRLGPRGAAYDAEMSKQAAARGAKDSDPRPGETPETAARRAAEPPRAAAPERHDFTKPVEEWDASSKESRRASQDAITRRVGQRVTNMKGEGQRRGVVVEKHNDGTVSVRWDDSTGHKSELERAPAENFLPIRLDYKPGDHVREVTRRGTEYEERREGTVEYISGYGVPMVKFHNKNGKPVGDATFVHFHELEHVGEPPMARHAGNKTPEELAAESAARRGTPPPEKTGKGKPPEKFNSPGQGVRWRAFTKSGRSVGPFKTRKEAVAAAAADDEAASKMAPPREPPPMDVPMRAQTREEKAARGSDSPTLKKAATASRKRSDAAIGTFDVGDDVMIRNSAGTVAGKVASIADNGDVIVDFPENVGGKTRVPPGEIVHNDMIAEPVRARPAVETPRTPDVPTSAVRAHRAARPKLADALAKADEDIAAWQKRNRGKAGRAGGRRALEQRQRAAERRRDELQIRADQQAYEAGEGRQAAPGQAAEVYGAKLDEFIEQHNQRPGVTPATFIPETVPQTIGGATRHRRRTKALPTSRIERLKATQDILVKTGDYRSTAQDIVNESRRAALAQANLDLLEGMEAEFASQPIGSQVADPDVVYVQKDALHIPVDLEHTVGMHNISDEHLASQFERVRTQLEKARNNVDLIDGFLPEDTSNILQIPRPVYDEAIASLKPYDPGNFALHFDKLNRGYQRFMLSKPSTLLSNVLGNPILAMMGGASPWEATFKGYKLMKHHPEWLPPQLQEGGLASQLRDTQSFTPVGRYINWSLSKQRASEQAARHGLYHHLAGKHVAEQAALLDTTADEVLRRMAAGIDPMGFELAKRVEHFLGDMKRSKKFGPGFDRGLGRAFLFHRWLGHILTLSLYTLPIKYPGRAMLLQRISEIGDDYRKHHGVFPSWYMGMLPLMQHIITSNGTPESYEFALPTGSIWPTANLPIPLGEDQGANPLAFAWNSVNPGIRATVESLTGMNMATLTPYKDEEGKPIRPGWNPDLALGLGQRATPYAGYFGPFADMADTAHVFNWRHRPRKNIHGKPLPPGYGGKGSTPLGGNTPELSWQYGLGLLSRAAVGGSGAQFIPSDTRRTRYQQNRVDKKSARSGYNDAIKKIARAKRAKAKRGG